jgi:hypothetical protein
MLWCGPLLWSKTHSPALRIAVAVPDGNDLDPLLLDPKQHGVRESTEQRRVNTTLVRWEGLREPSDAREARFIAVARSEVPPEIRWECTVCLDGGRITGWADTAWDHRGRFAQRGLGSGSKRLAVSFERSQYRALLARDELDLGSHVLLCRGRPASEGLALAASAEELEFLAGDIVAAADHEPRPARARQLRAAFRTIEAVVAAAAPVRKPRRARAARRVYAAYRIRIGDVLLRSGDWILYVYDFGDDWRHTIELEEMLFGSEY